MADVVPDRYIDMKDVRAASNNFGKNGTYTTDNWAEVTIKFYNSSGIIEEKHPDSDGFATISQGTTSFVTRYQNQIGAMIIFW